MVLAYRIQSNLKQVIDKVNGRLLKVPEALADEGFKFTKRLQRNYRLHLTRKKHNDTMKLWKGIRAVRVSSRRSELRMPIEGIHLDRMKPHWVKLKRGRKIRGWVNRKSSGYFHTKMSGRDVLVPADVALKYQLSIKVKPHPFIDNVFARTYISLNRDIQNRLKRTIEG